MNNNESATGEIVMYQPDETIRLEVRVEDETVWLTQQQMAELFLTTKQNVSLHVNNIFREDELTESSVVKESLTTAKDGKRYKTKMYNHHRRCGLRLWGQSEGSWQETLRLHPHARDLCLGSAQQYQIILCSSS